MPESRKCTHCDEYCININPSARKWIKTPYGMTQNDAGDWVHDGGHWTLTNGQLMFDVHVQHTSIPEIAQANVSPAQANEYAERILAALNAEQVDIA